jgi:SAM-dependent methyltransferase
VKLNRANFLKMVEKDSKWIQRTVGKNGTIWMLQKELFAGEKYKHLTEYTDKSLIEWISGTKGKKTNHWESPNGIDLSHMERFSNKKHHILVGDAVPEIDVIGRDKRNVYDFFYTNLVTNQRNTVADIGAGYARNSFLFLENGSNYICVDGIEKCYMMQKEILTKLYGNRVTDYLDNQDLKRKDIADLLLEGAKTDPKIIHIPTWRLDLIPDECVDIVMFVFSLEEMPVKTARFCLDSSVRIASKKAIIYLRGLFLRDINCLHPEIYAKFNGLIKVLDLKKMYPEDAPGQTLVFRKDNRSSFKKVKDFIHPWKLYIEHNIKKIKE